MIHAANSVCIAIDAGNLDASLHHCLHRIAYCQSNSLLILLERAETEICFWMANGMFKKMDIDRHGLRLKSNNCKILDPPYFLLPTTKKNQEKFAHFFTDFRVRSGTIIPDPELTCQKSSGFRPTTLLKSHFSPRFGSQLIILFIHSHSLHD
jgi:hypothetical protein